VCSGRSLKKTAESVHVRRDSDRHSSVPQKGYGYTVRDLYLNIIYELALFSKILLAQHMN